MFLSNAFQAINYLDRAIDASIIIWQVTRKAAIWLLYAVVFVMAFAWYLGESIGESYYAAGYPGLEKVGGALVAATLITATLSAAAIKWTVEHYPAARDFSKKMCEKDIDTVRELEHND